jgi:putative tryptophan/tyrosine transport system substrate-binding protein
MMSEDAGYAERFLSALFATVVKPISDLRLLISGLCALLLALSFPAEAQQPTKIPRVGLIRPERAGDPTGERLVDALRQGLRELGYVEGLNIALEIRWFEGKRDRLPEVASELVRLKVDVIVAGGTSVTRAAKKETSTIPIIMWGVGGDVVAEGLVASLARPGGNITGLTTLSTELSGKRLELLKETVPKASRVAVLSNPDNPETVSRLKETEDAAKVFGVTLQSLKVRTLNEIESAFGATAKERTGALIVLSDALFNAHRTQITDLAIKNRLPTIYASAEFVEVGGLMSYAPNLPDLSRRSAIYVDKILKGTKPADLPVEAPLKFELVINLKAAKQIGLTVPPNVLARADRVVR